MGKNEGEKVGGKVGVTVGENVGRADGVYVGGNVGEAVGIAEGTNVGERDGVVLIAHAELPRVHPYDPVIRVTEELQELQVEDPAVFVKELTPQGVQVLNPVGLEE